jgi:Flp pilus assembly protein TadD
VQLEVNVQYESHTFAEGKAHEQQGSMSEATRDFETAVRVTPQLSEAWYHLTAAYDRAGRASDAPQARRQFEQLKANKESQEADILRDAFVKAMAGPHPGP